MIEMPDFGDNEGMRWIPVPTEQWNEVRPGLWQGGTMSGSRYPRRADFDVVLTLHQREQVYGMGGRDPFAPEGGIQHREWFIHDGAELPSLIELESMAGWVRRRWERGERCLVRCQAGLNRSGLVVATILIESGYTPDEAVMLIRKERSPYAMCNPTFIEYLNSLQVST